MIWLIVGLALLAFWFVLVPLFERVAPPRAVRAYQRLSRPMFLYSAGIVPGFGVVETVGRNSGKPRRTPVGGRKNGRTFWLVAGIGRRTQYVRNIERDPRVRVRTHGRWHDGTAKILDEDNWRRRMFWVNPMNGFFLWLAGGEGVTVEITLDD